MLALGAALSFTACSDDPMINGGGGNGLTDDDGPGVYISATISLPGNGSRSATDAVGDNDGQTNSNGSSNSGNPNTDSKNPTVGLDFEEGTSDENEIRTMVLVIATEKNEYITHLVATGMTTKNGTEYTAVSKIPYNVLETLYGVPAENSEGGASEATGTAGAFKDGTKGNPHKVRLFAYCNFTNDILNAFDGMKANSGDTKWIHNKGIVEEKASLAGEVPQSTNSIWSPRSFLMTNASIYTAEFPGTVDEWTDYADDKYPLDLTTNSSAAGATKPIPVERVAARFDFRDASHDNLDENQKKFYPDNSYPIRITIGDASGDETSNGRDLFAVEFTRMILVNMAKEYYYLRRVGTDQGSEEDGTFDLLGVETASNWVIDPLWSEERGHITPAVADQYFNFTLFDKEYETNGEYNNVGGKYGWYISTIEDVLDQNNRNDKWTNSEGNPPVANGYKVWRYVTENTLPGIENQQVQQSTGIIFKARIRPGMELKDSEFVSDSVKSAFDKIYGLEKGYEPLLDDEKKDWRKNYTQSHTDPTDYPGFYMFNNMLYAYPEDIVAKAKVDGIGGTLYYPVQQILKHWYLYEYLKGEEDITPSEKKVFKYMENQPTQAAAKETLSSVNGADSVNIVTLTIEIADEILNGTTVSDGTKDYSQGYQIDFKADEDKCPDELDGFKNSQFMLLCPQQNITVFIPTDDDGAGLGYYCYYFYWNRHNDNGLSGKMGPMEFATVRNNVYKIAVTKVSAFGHPRHTDRDPDPVKPNDPDEDPTRSIQVEVKVLPWVVRVNNIEF